MAESQNHSHFLNPWVLNLEKLGLELKCSLCLKMYNKPMLLPCDHIFCSSCVPKSNLFGLVCALCKSPYSEQDLRQAPFVENVINIYRCLDSSFSSQMVNSDLAIGSAQCRFPNQTSNRRFDSTTPGNSNSGTCGNAEQHEAVDVDMNQMESPDSPPSSGLSKDDTTGKCLSKKPTKRTVDDFGAEGFDKSYDLNYKKQKQISQGVPEMINAGNIPTDQQAVEFDPTSSCSFLCAFCQSWKITEGSGPMQHFANGRQVFGSEATRPCVIHVHQSCIDWAPQIYYENDTTLKNLDKELARACKLKCTTCGLKGAALGCFAKSCRRSYHAPCAYNIEGCRWETKEFLMLCPTHASQKFPSERSKKTHLKKCSTIQTYNEPKIVCDIDFWAKSPTGAKNWVLCGSALSADEKYKLVKFANMCGATVTKAWTPNVTHVIAATDANGACSRTLKVLMAILNGRWILKTDWIEACMLSKCPIDEEPYEIGLDNHGCTDAPKTGRLRALNNEPKLFSSIKFFFNGEYVATYKKDLQNLIIAAGGTLVEREEQLQQSSNEPSHPPTTIIVYNDDSTGEVNEVWLRQLDAEKLALDSGSQVIAHTWILDSIASGELQPKQEQHRRRHRSSTGDSNTEHEQRSRYNEQRSSGTRQRRQQQQRRCKTWWWRRRWWVGLCEEGEDA